MRREAEPDPEFVDRLEWQLQSELRRGGHRPDEGRRGGGRWWRTAAVVAVSLLAGFASATAAQEISDRRTRELLVVQADGVVRIAELRRAMVEQRLLEVRKRVEAGVVAEIELTHARVAIDRAEREVRRARLDVDEIELSSDRPRDDLAAPLVGGEDFVLERLLLRLDDMRDERQLFELSLARLQDRADSGIKSPAEVSVYYSEYDRLDREVSLLRRDIRLRESFIAGEADERTVLARQERSRAEARVQDAAGRVQSLEVELSALADGVEAGVESALVLAEMEYQVELARVELELAEAELDYALEHWAR